MCVNWRNTFDEAASLYDVRPPYPQEIIEAILAYSQLSAEGNILEVGVGTGQITLPFAQRGFCITGLELGENLAHRARQNLQGFPKVKIEHADFETWQTSERFDLLLSAQAFHWIDPDIGLKQAAKFLNPSGSIALVWTLDESHTTAFYQATTPLYERFFSPQQHSPRNYLRYKTALEQSHSFDSVTEYAVIWEHSFSKDTYLNLQKTYSPYLSLQDASRKQFLEALSKHIDDFGGTVLRHYKTVLVLARNI